MSLFSSIQLANNSLIATQIGLQVTGNNIANAHTPGYIREEVVLTPAQTQRVGDLLLGMGVEVEAVIQKTDAFLEDRLRGAIADLANGETQESTYLQLESLIGELTDTDLSTSLGNFFGSINDILSQPESISVRNMAVLQGDTLVRDISRLSRNVRELREDVNSQIIDTADNINRLLEDIAKLNVQIVIAEGGSVLTSDAVGLRDKRAMALSDLSALINIQAVEQPTGSVSVFSGGDNMVVDGLYREVTTHFTPDRGIGAAEIRLEATDAPIDVSSGKLAGLIASRDEILGGFLDRLDEFAATLIFEFNKLHASGQGLKGHTELASEFAVGDVDVALDEAGLKFTPVNGSFQVQVYNQQTGLTQTTDVFVPLNGLDDDMTLAGLATALDEIDGISAATTPSRGLAINADSPIIEIAFANDTSGVLAALGLNTFFTGFTALHMGISEVVRQDPAKFAASQTGIGSDAENAVVLGGFLDRELESAGGDSLAVLYDGLVAQTSQSAAVARAVAEGSRVFQKTLEGQKLAVSGVSLDEEAVKLITYQRMYQASARYIATLAEILDVLVNL